MACASVGSIIVDDIYQGDSEIKLGVLGGSGLYAAMGMALSHNLISTASRAPYLVARVGHDFEPTLTSLSECFSIDAISFHPSLPTTRARQRYGADGVRVHEWITSPEDFRTHFRPELPTALPESFRRADGWQSIGIHLDYMITRALAVLQVLRPIASLIVFEPVPPSYNPQHLNLFSECLSLVDVFSPSLEELRWLFNDPTLGPEDAIVRVHAELGAQCVVLRLGELGSMISGCPLGEDQAQMSFPVCVKCAVVPQVVDPTGAGNAFCGAIAALCGVSEEGGQRWGIVESVVAATVAASFVIEQFGPPLEAAQARGDNRWKNIAAERMAWVRQVSFGEFLTQK
eukprot:c7061_g1_i1.p1 GENE.c7061_g1_i1~~c7061_g1_i1.p1  ORF type:complete len:355 (-),score=55.44 c7061_g1_i1:22-1053(-)